MVPVSHHAVAEATTRQPELKRHEQIIRVRSESSVTASQDIVDDPGITNTRQEVFDHNPLIMSPQNSSRFIECMASGHDGVMRAQKGYVQLCDDQILVVALIADQSSSIIAPIVAAGWSSRQVVRFARGPGIRIDAGYESQHHPGAVS